MARFYVTRLLPATLHRHTFVSLHDVYNPLMWVDGHNLRAETRRHWLPEWMPNPEGALVLDWLSSYASDSCRLFTISPSKFGNEPIYEATYAARRDQAGLYNVSRPNPATRACPEPTIWFELGCRFQVSRDNSLQKQ